MPTRGIGILRWVAAVTLAYCCLYFLGRAGGHIELNADAETNPFVLSYQGTKWAGLAVASALCAVSAILLLRVRPRRVRLGAIFLALAALAAAEPFAVRYLGAEHCRTIGGHWSDQFRSCMTKVPID